jgi:hypothetical protein
MQWGWWWGLGGLQRAFGIKWSWMGPAQILWRSNHRRRRSCGILIKLRFEDTDEDISPSTGTRNKKQKKRPTPGLHVHHGFAKLSHEVLRFGGTVKNVKTHLIPLPDLILRSHVVRSQSFNRDDPIVSLGQELCRSRRVRQHEQDQWCHGDG